MNPLYNDTFYNIKIRYNINSIFTKISGFVYFFIDSSMLLFRKAYDLDSCKKRLAEAILKNTQNV